MDNIHPRAVSSLGSQYMRLSSAWRKHCRLASLELMPGQNESTGRGSIRELSMHFAPTLMIMWLGSYADTSYGYRQK